VAAVNALYHSRLLGPKGEELLFVVAFFGFGGKDNPNAGTGGVSCFAIQLASAAGARAASATDLINCKTTLEWANEVRKLTGRKGVDLAIEVGGSATTGQSLKATKQGGTLVGGPGFLTASKQMALVPVLLFGAKTGMFWQCPLTPYKYADP
jgi:NADPH:quinone reductase-like Zn-dependent oxidoreductase